MKTALITGVATGIGAATARRLSALGYFVAGCGRSPRDAIPGVARYDVCDVMRAESVRAWVDAIGRDRGSIDVLVNDAGIAGGDSLDPDADDELWHAMIATHVHGPYYATKAALRYLRSPGGRVVNVGSVLSLQGVPDMPAYCAAKHAVLGFTRASAKLLGSRGITVNCVCPGWTDTEMARERWNELGMTARTASREMPIGRVVRPDEVADAIAYLVSAEAVTGQFLTIDGGATP